MLQSLKVVSIFLASPSDVSAERAIVEQVCDEIRQDLGRIHKFTIELRRWETHAGPGIDESAQQVISSKIGKDYNIFLGLFGRKFGTPTLRWRSGTEEEFRIAHSSHLASGTPKIMLYFSNTAIDPYSVDLTQLAMVRDFQNEASLLGILYWVFSDPSEFKIMLRRHLIGEVVDLLSTDLQVTSAYGEVGAVEFDPLQNFKLLQESDSSVRAHVLLRSGILAFKVVEKDTSLITKSLNKLSSEVAHFARELGRVTRSGNSNSDKIARELDRFFEAIESYVDSFYFLVPRLRTQFEIGVSSQFRGISILKALEDVEKADTAPLVLALGATAETLSQVYVGIETLNKTLVEQPMLGEGYEVRRKMLIAINSDFLSFLSWARQALLQFQSDTISEGKPTKV